MAVTNDDGDVRAGGTPGGSYAVTVNAPGFAPVAQNVVVSVGLDTTADFGLFKVEKQQESVTVTGSAPLVEATRDVLGEVVDQRLVAELPLNGRDFGKLVALVPGATVEPSGVAAIQSGFGQFSINGNRDRSNNYTRRRHRQQRSVLQQFRIQPDGDWRRARIACCRLMRFRNSTCSRNFAPSTDATAGRSSTS